MTNWSPKVFVQDYKQGKRRINLAWIHCSIIILMCIIVLSSLICSASIHVLGSSFDWHKIFSAKFAFTPRTLSSNDDTLPLFMTIPPENSSTPLSISTLIASDITINKLNETIELENKTKKPKLIKHIFRMTDRIADDSSDDDDDDIDEEHNETTTLKYSEAEAEKNDYEDRLFVLKMQLDLRKIRWGSERLLNYIVYYPYFSEIVAIIWAVMTLIYQSGSKGNWMVPEPWRIVVPSLAVFFVMAIISFCSTLVGRNAVNNFCDELRSGLKNRNAVQCGYAILHFRLEDTTREFDFETYLRVFHAFNIMQTLCWILSLCVMFIRFILAIDFQLIDTTITTTISNDLDSDDQIIADIMYSDDQSNYDTIESRSASQNLQHQLQHHQQQSRSGGAGGGGGGVSGVGGDDDEDFYSTKSHNTNETTTEGLISLQPLLEMKDEVQVSNLN